MPHGISCSYVALCCAEAAVASTLHDLQGLVSPHRHPGDPCSSEVTAPLAAMDGEVGASRFTGLDMSQPSPNAVPPRFDSDGSVDVPVLHEPAMRTSVDAHTETFSDLSPHPLHS